MDWFFGKMSGKTPKKSNLKKPTRQSSTERRIVTFTTLEKSMKEAQSLVELIKNPKSSPEEKRQLENQVAQLYTSLLEAQAVCEMVAKESKFALPTPKPKEVIRYVTKVNI